MNANTYKLTRGFFIWIITFQIIFIASMLFLRNYYIVPSSFFHKLSYEEWAWYLQLPSKPYESVLILLCDILEKSAYLVSLVGIMLLAFTKKYVLPLSMPCRLVILATGVLLYFAVVLCFKYFAMHYSLAMELACAEVPTLTLLALILFARKNVSRKGPLNS